MNVARRSLPSSYFDALYASDPDPWKFATSRYEQKKYDATLAALPRLRYPRAFEVGCSIGVLTRRLAPRCDRLLAVDAAAAPLLEARRRCADQRHVTFAQRAVPAEWPDRVFDLIMLSEVVYYLDIPDLMATAGLACSSLAAGGDLVLVHWTGETDYPLSGDEASDLFIGAMQSRARLLRQERTGRYRLDVLRGL